MRKKALKWIDWTRQQELEALAEYLAPAAQKSARLLEIGGGNGFSLTPSPPAYLACARRAGR